jgi:hypothetical protein
MPATEVIDGGVEGAVCGGASEENGGVACATVGHAGRVRDCDGQEPMEFFNEVHIPGVESLSTPGFFGEAATVIPGCLPSRL